MGIFSNMFNRWAEKRQRKEIQSFIHNLRAMDGPELGSVVAVATDIRHKLEVDSHVLMDPINYFAVNPGFLYLLSSTTIKLQKQNKLTEAAGMMVWVHTFRAAARLELRGLGREMWKELERGFLYIDESVSGFAVLTGNILNTEDANSFPIGLAPEK
jgi:hypothetical protein